MSITIYVGCMFSGKSERLLRDMARYEAIATPTLLINSSLDSRTDDSVKTHSNQRKKGSQGRSAYEPSIGQAQEFV